MQGWFRAVTTLVTGMTVSATLAVAQPRSAVFQADGVALRGYDVVSYFEGKAEAGSDAYQVSHEGVQWRFVSAAHRDRFAADPARFLPQYGGYCALGMAHGGAVPSDPTAFTVHQGKLYLNSNKLTRVTWAYAKDWMIGRADPNWTTWLARVTAAATRPPAPNAGFPRPRVDTTLALAGLDATTYHDAGGPVAGDSTIVTTYRGRTWRFTSDARRARFLARPDRFAPQFDGLSPLILAHGDQVPGDPAKFTIVNDKVYLDVADGPQTTFRRNARKLIARADSIWRTLPRSRS
jgi:YHS domain-containing protein